LYALLVCPLCEGGMTCDIKAGFRPKQLATSNRRYAICVACRNSMHFSVNSSHRNDSDIAFKTITQ
jgi:hypothetical protein